MKKAVIRQIFKISEKSNGRIIEKWLKFLSSHSVLRSRSLKFIPAFFVDLKIWNLC